MSASHNKDVLQPSRYKILCLQATTNVSSGLKDIFVVACRHKTLYYRAGGHICCGLQPQYLVPTGLEDIFVMACRHNTLYILGWRTYLLWPADTIPCIYITILSPLCGELQWLKIVHTSTCIHMLTGTRYLKGLRPQLKVKQRALLIALASITYTYLNPYCQQVELDNHSLLRFRLYYSIWDNQLANTVTPPCTCVSNTSYNHLRVVMEPEIQDPEATDGRRNGWWMWTVHSMIFILLISFRLINYIVILKGYNLCTGLLFLKLSFTMHYNIGQVLICPKIYLQK